MSIKIERIKTAALCTTLVCIMGGGVAYVSTSASADGIPQDSPMTYAGVLEENGRLVDDTRNFRLTVWDSSDSTEFDNLKCSTQASNVAIEAGHFRVPLSNTCTVAVHENPDLWVEVEVGGQVVGRTKMGAVPYALEATRASELVQEAQDLLVPPGTVIAFAGPVIPQGWLLADGSELIRDDFPRLFAAIGTAHGTGNTSTTFHIPDYRGMFLRGVDHERGRDPHVGNRTAGNPGGNVGGLVGSVQEDSIGNHVHNIQHSHSMRHRHGMLHDHGRGNMIATIHLGDTGRLHYERDCDGPRWNQRLARSAVGSSTTSGDGDDRTCSARVLGRTANSRTDTDFFDGPTGTFTGDSAGIKNQSGESRPKNAYVNYIIKY